MFKLMRFFQEKVVFLPVALPDDYHFHFKKDFEEYYFERPEDGLLNALLFKTKNPKGVILYFHGNADNLKRWGTISQKFTDYDYDVFVYDYRGYGKSKGNRDEKLLFDDAQFCYDVLKEKYGEENIIIYGISLGGAFATKTASNNTPKMLILECTFYNLQDMANRYIPNFVTNIVSNYVTYHFDSKEHLKKTRVPLYFFHGNRDWVVPIKSGKKLFKIFEEHQPELEKKFIEIKGGNHINLESFELYKTEMKKILEK